MSQVITDGEMPSEALPQGCCRQPGQWASSFREAGCALFEIQVIHQRDSIADFIQAVIDKVDGILCVSGSG
jgi:hypothetical protein